MKSCKSGWKSRWKKKTRHGNNFFSRVFERKDDITDEELDRFFAYTMERIKMQEELQKEEREERTPS